MEWVYILAGSCGGGLLLCGILVLGVVWYLQRKLNDFARALEATAQSAQIVPPLRLRLRPRVAIAWNDSRHADALTAALRTCGFQDIGEFTAAESELKLRALVLPDQRVAAAVCEDPEGGVWCEVTRHFEDGRHRVFTTARPTGVLEPPNFEFTNLPDEPPARLLESLQKRHSSEPAIEVDADTFVPVFEKAYADRMDWQMERGGPTEDEIRHFGHEFGLAKTDKLVRQIRELWESRVAAFYADQLRDAFGETSGMSNEEWDRVQDRLVFIHDRLSNEELVDFAMDAYAAGDEELNPQEWDAMQDNLERVVSNGAARQKFTRLNEVLGGTARSFTKLGTVETPFQADVYLAPDAGINFGNL